MTFTFEIPTLSGPKTLNIETGTSLYFVGANGGGKTRLAVLIEEKFKEKSHRISAHRHLTLNPNIIKISEAQAKSSLSTGNHLNNQINVRNSHRWNNKPETALLNDFDALIQTLFAEQNNTALETHNNIHAGVVAVKKETLFQKLIKIWNKLVTHRILIITGDSISVSHQTAINIYSASDMSDGERSVFYLIGQVLVAAENSILIFDEPELHIHRSIMSRLWDELEAARPDCAMIFISHDLQFVASRNGQKFVLKDYSPEKGWSIEDVPEDTGFSEELVTLILGSRKPVLFVEGEKGSLDLALYRACYPDWTIVPRGSCEEVIHSVVTMRKNESLTRVTCAGLVDADSRTVSEINNLSEKNIGVLPVSEIENLFLMPTVVKAIAKHEGLSGAELTTKLTAIETELLAHAAEPKNQNDVVMRYCRRHIDRTLKSIDLKEFPDLRALSDGYKAQTDALDVTQIAGVATSAIKKSITDKDVKELLKWYDNKGLLNIAAKAKNTSKSNFEQWIIRIMQNDSAPDVRKAVKDLLPVIEEK